MYGRRETSTEHPSAPLLDLKVLDIHCPHPLFSQPDVEFGLGFSDVEGVVAESLEEGKDQGSLGFFKLLSAGSWLSALD